MSLTRDDAPRSPVHPLQVLTRAILQRDGHLTLLNGKRMCDHTAFALIGAGIVYLDQDRTDEEWQADLAHELGHIWRPDWDEERVEAFARRLLSLGAVDVPPQRGPDMQAQIHAAEEEDLQQEELAS